MKLRLLKVIVQPVFVVDDGDSLREQAAEPVSVPAADWPGYATGAFAEGFETLRRQVEGPPETPAKPEHNGRVTKPPRKRTPAHVEP